MLENFLNDSMFPTTSVRIFAEASTFDTTTGIFTKTYKQAKVIDAWVYQKAAFEQFLGGVKDSVDLVLITAETIDKTSMVVINSQWYTLVFPDSIMLGGDVIVIGLASTQKPVSDIAAPAVPRVY